MQTEVASNQQNYSLALVSQKSWSQYSLEFDVNINGMEEKRINRLSGI
jgi:hypothetical protein